MKQFEAKVWVHAGGDDESYKMDIKAPTRGDAIEEIMSFLIRKKSRKFDDWELEEV